MPLLRHHQVNIVWDRVRRPNNSDPDAHFSAMTNMSNEIGILYLFPGITAQVVKGFLSSGLKGVVLKTFGAGNFSQQEDILSVFQVRRCPPSSRVSLSARPLPPHCS